MAVCGRRPILTEKQAAEVRAWARFGRSVADVARKLGVSDKVVRKAMRDELKAYRRRKES